MALRRFRQANGGNKELSRRLDVTSLQELGESSPALPGEGMLAPNDYGHEETCYRHATGWLALAWTDIPVLKRTVTCLR